MYLVSNSCLVLLGREWGYNENSSSCKIKLQLFRSSTYSFAMWLNVKRFKSTLIQSRTRKNDVGVKRTTTYHLFLLNKKILKMKKIKFKIIT